jgi:ribosomal protein L44E
MDKKKKLAGLALALLMTNNSSDEAVARNFNQPPILDDTSVSATSDRVIDNKVAKEKLIKALKDMKRNPESVKFHSAMCYKVSRPPKTFDYTCPDCGTVTTHKYRSKAGNMARETASIRRSLSRLPTKVSMSEKSLCSKCKQDEKIKLDFSTSCCECGKNFVWDVDNNMDLAKMDYLFLNFPVTDVDNGLSRGPQINPKKTKEIVEYVSQRLFCPDCIKKLDLTITK